MPPRTTLTGALKHIVRGAADADPLERLRVAERLDISVRDDWSSTGEDRMMAIIGPPLAALAHDDEPAVRELALLTLDACAARLWMARAYGLYEPICRQLIDAGLNAHLQHARLAESALAAGDLHEAERLRHIAAEGQNPERLARLDTAYDAFGDWNDLRTRIYRQAGGAHWAWSQGRDPNAARQDKLAERRTAWRGPSSSEKTAAYQPRVAINPPTTAQPSTTAHGGAFKRINASSAAAASSPSATDCKPWRPTGSISAASSTPTTAAFTAERAARADGTDFSRSQNGSAPATSKKAGAKMASRATKPPSQPEGASARAAPRNAAKVNSGPGTACAAP